MLLLMLQTPGTHIENWVGAVTADAPVNCTPLPLLEPTLPKRTGKRDGCCGSPVHLLRRGLGRAARPPCCPQDSRPPPRRHPLSWLCRVGKGNATAIAGSPALPDGYRRLPRYGTEGTPRLLPAPRLVTPRGTSPALSTPPEPAAFIFSFFFLGEQ